MIFVSFVVAGFLVGSFRGGRASRLTTLPLRLGALVLLPLLVQIFLFRNPFPALTVPEEMVSPIYVLSILLLVGVVILNHSLAGMKILGIGLFLNFLVIATNGGLMPVSTEQMETNGLANQATSLRNSTRINHLIAADDSTRLAFLGDVFVTPAFLPFHSVYSVGDVVIGIGAFRLVYAGMFYRRRYVFRSYN